MNETEEDVIGALRRVGFGPNDFLVKVEKNIGSTRSVELSCDKCGTLGSILTDDDWLGSTELEGMGSEHVRRKAVEEGIRHEVKIGPKY